MEEKSAALLIFIYVVYPSIHPFIHRLTSFVPSGVPQGSAVGHHTLTSRGHLESPIEQVFVLWEEN